MVEVIARTPEHHERVSYYLRCQEGRPVFGPKHRAAILGDQLPVVLRHLRTMMPNEEFETVGQMVRFRRRPKVVP